MSISDESKAALELSAEDDQNLATEAGKPIAVETSTKGLLFADDPLSGGADVGIGGES
jgi:hypothetical protein